MSPSSRHPHRPAAVVVLAGGRSERFGSDKTRAEVDGRPLLERVLGAVDDMDRAVAEVLVVGPWAPDGVRHLIEPDRFGGPLAALTFALAEVSAPVVLVLAADHPVLQPALLDLLIDRLVADPAADVVVPVRGSHREPLVAAYRRSVATVAQELLSTGERSLRSLLEVVAVAELVEHEWHEVDPHGRSFVDIDRREDLRDHEP